MLIKCPECGKEISDQALSCPNCGYPINAAAAAPSAAPSSDGDTVKLKIAPNVYGVLNPPMVIYINGIEVWRGNVGQVAELKLTGKTFITLKIHKIPVASKNGSFEGEIDPAFAKNYVLKPVRKTFNMLHFRPYPVETL